MEPSTWGTQPDSIMCKILGRARVSGRHLSSVIDEHVAVYRDFVVATEIIRFLGEAGYHGEDGDLCHASGKLNRDAVGYAAETLGLDYDDLMNAALAAAEPTGQNHAQDWNRAAAPRRNVEGAVRALSVG